MALVACSNERQALELGWISILALLASAIDIASIGAQEQSSPTCYAAGCDIGMTELCTLSMEIDDKEEEDRHTKQPQTSIA
jgi:hypothetical protein